MADEFQALAVAAYRALRCRGHGPGRLLLRGRAAEGLLLNEINTIPGFTPISMYPKLWAATGLPYDQLIDELVGLAVERWARRAPAPAPTADPQVTWRGPRRVGCVVAHRPGPESTT